MQTKLEQAKILRKTAARLIKQAEQLEAGIAPNNCKYMTDTGEPKLKNHPCKGNAITCSHPEIGKEAAIHMTTKKCNAKNCNFFQADNA